MRLGRLKRRAGWRVAAFAVASCVLACGGGETAPPTSTEVTPEVVPVAPPAPVPVPEVVPDPAPDPAPPSAAPVVIAPDGVDRPRLVVGGFHVIAIGQDGRVYRAAFREHSSTVTAEVVAGIDGAESLAASGEMACALTRDHRVLCWSNASRAPQALPVEPLVDARAIVRTRDAVCARDGAGAVNCYGHGLRGIRDERTDAAFTLSLPRPAVQIAGGYGAVCAVLDDGTLQCAGYVGTMGATGYGAVRDVHAPWPVGSVVVEDSNVCARSADGEHVACAGDVGDWYYEDVDFEDDERGPVSAMEAPVISLTDVDIEGHVTSISTNMSHACALTSGRVRCWGAPYRDGRTEGFTTREAPGLRDVVELAGGGEDRFGVTCAIQRDDLPVCWIGGRSLGRGAPGTPRLTICHPDGPEGTCVELRLAHGGPARIAATDAPPTMAAPPTSAPPPPAPAAAAPRCVVADSSGTPLNVRAEASTRAAVVGTLVNGTEVTLDETRGHFRHLTAPISGWAWSDNIACE